MQKITRLASIIGFLDRTSAINVAYHGTSESAARKMLQQGMKPSAPGSGGSDSHLPAYYRTFGGVYLTVDPIRAMSYAWKTAKIAKEKPAIVAVSVDTSDATMDEDSIPNPVTSAVTAMSHLVSNVRTEEQQDAFMRKWASGEYEDADRFEANYFAQMRLDFRHSIPNDDVKAWNIQVRGYAEKALQVMKDLVLQGRPFHDFLHHEPPQLRQERERIVRDTKGKMEFALGPDSEATFRLETPPTVDGKNRIAAVLLIEPTDPAKWDDDMESWYEWRVFSIHQKAYTLNFKTIYGALPDSQAFLKGLTVNDPRNPGGYRIV